MAERSRSLVIVGWLALVGLYCAQVALLVSILVLHLDDLRYLPWFLLFLPALAVTCCRYVYDIKERKFKAQYATKDEEIWFVWGIWGAYIVPYVATVGMIFGTVAHKLTKDDTLGINAFLGTLCITPALLILFLQLTICPSYRKPVLSLSVFAALNIFDGIEMLEIFLMQKEANFDLNEQTEISIVVFACTCFLLSSFGLVRNKFGLNGEVKERGATSSIFGLLEIIGTNLPFLVLRAIIWHKYEAAVFIAKNVVSLVIGAVEFLILKGKCKCNG